MQVSIDYNKEEITNNYQKFEKFESQIKTDNIDNQESISSLKKMQMQMLKQISSLQVRSDGDGKKGPDISKIQSRFGEGEQELTLKDVQKEIQTVAQVCNVLVESHFINDSIQQILTQT